LGYTHLCLFPFCIVEGRGARCNGVVCADAVWLLTLFASFASFCFEEGGDGSARRGRLRNRGILIGDEIHCLLDLDVLDLLVYLDVSLLHLDGLVYSPQTAVLLCI